MYTVPCIIFDKLCYNGFSRGEIEKQLEKRKGTLSVFSGMI